MQYRLRTLLILIGVGPPILAVLWWYFSPQTVRELADMAVDTFGYGLVRVLILLAGIYAVRWVWYGLQWVVYWARCLWWRFQNRE